MGYIMSIELIEYATEQADVLYSFNPAINRSFKAP
jgi:hypothetical protein